MRPYRTSSEVVVGSHLWLQFDHGPDHQRVHLVVAHLTGLHRVSGRHGHSVRGRCPVRRPARHGSGRSAARGGSCAATVAALRHLHARLRRQWSAGQMHAAVLLRPWRMRPRSPLGRAALAAAHGSSGAPPRVRGPGSLISAAPSSDSSTRVRQGGWPA